ncbi:NlpC/P60 family protein [Natronincola peptidivorans]|uniref:NlpC/P60 family protein n=1 Tax=Natronincola peptidivorans TaxID=426128 RepID=A0A1I0FBW7_9FIRM|nr:NlpC/P60 family protein [Natronincola peptidivorans]SET54687.1 NlpC/P60 family protein [Natronincola peptidivorans]
MNAALLEKEIEGLIDKYTNVPFVHNGRSLAGGVDCLGFVILFYKEFGIHLPDDDGMRIERNWYRKDPDRLVKGIQGLGGMEVGIHELQPLDLVYFAINRKVITHTGIMMNAKEFLHTRPIVGFSKTPLTGRWESRFRGAMRFII